MEFIFYQLFNSLSWAMVLFLFTSGFTIIYGLMKVINLAHGSFYLIGAYIGLTLIYYTGNLIIGAIGGGISIAILGMLMQRFLLRRFEHNHVIQVLLTWGFLILFSDLAFLIWGGEPKSIAKPLLLEGSINMGFGIYPIYRLILIVVGLIAAASLWYFFKSKYGVLLRAGIENDEMTSGLGVNISLLKILTFGAGSFLAGVAGVIGGPLVGIFPGLDLHILLLSLAIVIIGGIGSLKGAFIGSVVVGLLDTFIKAIFPIFALFTIFTLMVATLVLRPSGFFGAK